MAANPKPHPDQRRWLDEELALRTAVIVDPRLAELWQFVWSRSGHAQNSDALGPLLRMAYLAGYGDALGEERPGDLYRAIGIRRGPAPTPTRRGTERRPRRRRGSSGSSGT